MTMVRGEGCGDCSSKYTIVGDTCTPSFSHSLTHSPLDLQTSCVRGELYTPERVSPSVSACEWSKCVSKWLVGEHVWLSDIA